MGIKWSHTTRWDFQHIDLKSNVCTADMNQFNIDLLEPRVKQTCEVD